jgi:hypothetical protein
MNTLQELNLRAANLFEFPDLRDAKVKFDRVIGLNFISKKVDIIGTTAQVTPPIEVEEIINYTLADMHYIVEIKSISGATVAWDNLSANLTLTQVGDVYTISGFRNVTDWRSARDYLWTLPAGFATDDLIFLENTVRYYNGTTNSIEEVSWNTYDTDYYYDVYFQLETAQSTVATRIVQLEADFVVVSILQEYTIRMPAKFSMIAEAEIVQVAHADFTPAFTETVQGNMIADLFATPLPSVTSLTITPTKLAALSNQITRSYYSNTSTDIFDTNTPQVSTIIPYVRIVLTSTGGQFGTLTNKNSTYDVTSVPSVVNAQIEDIYFWPNVGVNTNIQFNWTQYHSEDNITFTEVVNKNFSLNHLTSNFPGQTYIFDTANTHTWNPSLIEQTYGDMDYLVVSGGGGAGSVGGNATGAVSGGGGGQVRYELDQSIIQTSYSVVVGAGGVAQSSAQPGEQSIFNLLDPYRGIGAYSTVVGYGRQHYKGGLGGGVDGNNDRYQGATMSPVPYSGIGDATGGGGGGANGDAVLRTGGNGLSVSHFNSTVYGYGGNGSSSTGSANVSSYTTSGSGGGYGGTDGQDGIVIIKTHS